MHIAYALIKDSQVIFVTALGQFFYGLPYLFREQHVNTPLNNAWPILLMAKFISCLLSFKLLPIWLCMNGTVFLSITVINLYSSKFSLENIGSDIVFTTISIIFFSVALKLKKTVQQPTHSTLETA